MAKMTKKTGKTVEAFELGKNSEMEKNLIINGLIKVIGETGDYRLMSTEAIAASGEGQQAHTGDFFKIDGKGNPYPNDRDWFLAHHRHIEGEKYEQIPQPNEAWFYGEDMIPAIQFLVDTGKLTITDDPKARFSAMLWGSMMSAPTDAAVMFYSITTNDAGVVTDVDFNFVIREEIEANYIMA